MHNIILIEDLTVDIKGNLDVTAILENEWRRKRGTYLFSSPDCAPLRATTTIFKECLPPGKTFRGLNRKQLVRLIDDYELFIHQEWKPLDPPVESTPEDNQYPGGRLFF